MDRYSADEIRSIKKGVGINKQFGSDVIFKVTSEAFDERNEMDIAALCRKVGKNLLIIHGDQDSTVPVADAEMMFSSSGGQKFIIRGRHHSDFEVGDFQSIFKSLGFI